MVHADSSPVAIQTGRRPEERITVSGLVGGGAGTAKENEGYDRSTFAHSPLKTPTPSCRMGRRPPPAHLSVLTKRYRRRRRSRRTTQESSRPASPSTDSLSTVGTGVVASLADNASLSCRHGRRSARWPKSEYRRRASYSRARVTRRGGRGPRGERSLGARVPKVRRTQQRRRNRRQQQRRRRQSNDQHHNKRARHAVCQRGGTPHTMRCRRTHALAAPGRSLVGGRHLCVVALCIFSFCLTSGGGCVRPCPPILASQDLGRRGGKRREQKKKKKKERKEGKKEKKKESCAKEAEVRER